MNEQRETNITARVKLTIHSGERFFGPGICELLEKIQETGSIQGAAAEMKMSYTKAWKIINRAEKEMGVSLIVRISGGKNGGSSALTAQGERAVSVYREMERKLAETASALLDLNHEVFVPAEPLDEEGS